MVLLKERLINFKKSVDAQASVPIPVNPADPGQGNHVVPIVEGGEVSYAEKLVSLLLIIEQNAMNYCQQRSTDS